MSKFKEWYTKKRPGYSYGGPLWQVAEEAFEAGYKASLLASAERPSNTRMQTDACQCKYPKPDVQYTFEGMRCVACNLPRR